MCRSHRLLVAAGTSCWSYNCFMYSTCTVPAVCRRTRLRELCSVPNKLFFFSFIAHGQQYGFFVQRLFDLDYCSLPLCRIVSTGQQRLETGYIISVSIKCSLVPIHRGCKRILFLANQFCCEAYGQPFWLFVSFRILVCPRLSSFTRRMSKARV